MVHATSTGFVIIFTRISENNIFNVYFSRLSRYTGSLLYVVDLMRSVQIRKVVKDVFGRWVFVKRREKNKRNKHYCYKNYMETCAYHKTFFLLFYVLARFIKVHSLKIELWRLDYCGIIVISEIEFLSAKIHCETVMMMELFFTR